MLEFSLSSYLLISKLEFSLYIYLYQSWNSASLSIPSKLKFSLSINVRAGILSLTAFIKAGILSLCFYQSWNSLSLSILIKKLNFSLSMSKLEFSLSLSLFLSAFIKADASLADNFLPSAKLAPDISLNVTYLLCSLPLILN